MNLKLQGALSSVSEINSFQVKLLWLEDLQGLYHLTLT